MSQGNVHVVVDDNVLHSRLRVSLNPILSRSSSALASYGSSVSLSQTSEVDDEVVPDARPAHSSLPHVGFSARNHQWSSVQASILSLFHSCRDKKIIESYKMTFLINEIRELNKSEIGPFIYDYYKNQLLQKGFRTLREYINKEVIEGANILTSIGEIWDFFFKEILPQLKFVLSPIQVKDLSIHQATLVGFRDYLLLKMEIEDILKELGENVPPSTTQMMLILQSVCESMPPSDNFLRLERLVALVVKPYLGYEGLYMGEQIPYIKAKRNPTRRISVVKKDNLAKIARSISVNVEEVTSQEEQVSEEWQGNIPSIMATLAPVREDDSYRRHSASALV